MPIKLLVTGGSGFIGTNLIQAFSEKKTELCNFDIVSPICPGQSPFWQEGDIMDPSRLAEIFQAFQPTHVVHLAARTDCDESTTVEEGFTANTIGARNVVQAVQACPSVERLIVTSTQFVIGPDHTPKDLYDYAPHTVYGQSKVVTEQIVREEDAGCSWTIIRPTNVWGPWHMRFRREFWRVVQKGLYLHPGRQPVMRCYGYVGNVVHQINQILEAPAGDIHRKVFYVGDKAINLYDWANGFSLRMRGKPARIVPRPILRVLGWVGDVAGKAGIAFPLTSSRYRSMTTSHVTPMETTFDQFGFPPFSMEQGIDLVVEWLETYDREFDNPSSVS